MRLFSTMAASAGGLGVLLEPAAAATTTTAVVHQKQRLLPPAPAAKAPAPQTISRASLLLLGATTGATTKSDGASSSTSYSCASSSFAPAATASCSCSFLQRCFFCHRQLADSMDIYIYRGDRAFCSEECRCRHILAEDDDACAWVVAPADCSSSTSLRHHQAVAGSSFTF